MAHQVFISYSSTDKTTADALCARLEAHGISCWIAPRDVLPSQMYGEAIVNAIQGSRLMVLIFSDEANHSAQVIREVERAASRSIPILPFRIENVPLSPSMEYFISAPHWLDAMTAPLDKHLEQVAVTAKQLLAGGQPAAEMAPEAQPAPPSMPPPPQPAISQAASPQPARSRVPLLLSGVAVLLLVLGGVWAVFRSWDQAPADPPIAAVTAPPQPAPLPVQPAPLPTQAEAAPAHPTAATKPVAAAMPAATPPQPVAAPSPQPTRPLAPPGAHLTPKQRQVLAEMTPQERQAVMQLPPQQRQAELRRRVQAEERRGLRPPPTGPRRRPAAQ